VLESVELSPHECEELLRSTRTGRVAVSTPHGPHIVPVNYAVVDAPGGMVVVLRTTPYSVVGTHARGAVMALEADDIDPEHQRGWSVLVRGRADVVDVADDPAVAEAVERARPPRPWAAGSRTLTVGIRIDEISGRRLGHDRHEVGVRGA